MQTQLVAAGDTTRELQSPRGTVEAFAPVLYRMRQLSELTGLKFWCVDALTGRVISSSDPDALPLLPSELLTKLEDVQTTSVFPFDSGLVFYVVPMPQVGSVQAAAVGYLLSRTGHCPQDLVMAAAEQGWSRSRLNEYLAGHPACSADLLQTLVEMAERQIDQRSEQRKWQADIEKLSGQIQQTYEEISLLHDLARHLQISRSPVELAELTLERLPDLVGASGNLIWIEENDQSPRFLTQGTVPLDEMETVRLITLFHGHPWPKPLVQNAIQSSPLAADYPGLNNFVLVPIGEGEHRSGWILSCNPSDGRDFGTVEASLLNSVATILGTHNRNIDLYRENEKLMVSFVRSLVSTLDAKDPYTAGHSERVALIARRLGEELGLPGKELRDLYMAGLLHDIGKIGVDDGILRKEGRLTDDEFDQIKRHPIIGYAILRGLENLHAILPGVRNHHEMVDGRGYPDGLDGQNIPLIARILAVADAYDAMSSDRPYRKGMPIEKLDAIFRHGAGKQWDPQVIDGYFRARDEIRRISQDNAGSFDL